MMAAGAPRHDAIPPSSGCQPAVSDRIHRCLSAPVAMNSGCAGVVPSAFGGAATAGGPEITPPSGCQPSPNCGACIHNCPSVPSTPSATARAVGAVTVNVNACVAGGLTPLLALTVIGYTPAVPAAGVPD